MHLPRGVDNYQHKECSHKLAVRLQPVYQREAAVPLLRFKLGFNCLHVQYQYFGKSPETYLVKQTVDNNNYISACLFKLTIHPDASSKP